MRTPLIALLTDFGTADHYVASMKAVLLARCPSAALVDISHDVPPQDVPAGALLLESCWKDFPRGTVFLGVVDPGVGTSRRGLAAEADGRLMVGPDNGLFSLVWARAARWRSVALPARWSPARDGGGAGGLTSGSGGRTFEGRDRFAPLAARLARGLPLGRAGRLLRDPVRIRLPVVVRTKDRLVAEVIHADRFGNLVTNLDAADLASWAGGRVTEVRAGRRRIDGPVGTYGEAVRGRPCALAGSTGRLEIAVRDGSAASRLGAGRGLKVTVVCW